MATLKMKKEFKEILEREGAFNNYLANLQDRINESTESQKNERIKKLNNSDNFNSFISMSFLWSATTEGQRYWNNISVKTL